jgi:hypothetical protein
VSGNEFLISDGNETSVSLLVDLRAGSWTFKE